MFFFFKPSHLGVTKIYVVQCLPPQAVTFDIKFNASANLLKYGNFIRSTVNDFVKWIFTLRPKGAELAAEHISIMSRRERARSRSII